MELLAYILIVFNALFFGLVGDTRLNINLFFNYWLILYIFLLSIIRLNFQMDIVVYANSMAYDTINYYYIREPVIWFGHRIIFNFIGSEYFTFIITDVILGCILFLALRNFQLPRYAFFSILVFFPVMLGMQNIYRQWASLVFILYAISLLEYRSKMPGVYVWYSLAVLSHNVALVFLPLLFLQKKGLLSNFVLSITFIVAVVGLVIGASTKTSDISSGLPLQYLYVLCLAMLLLFFLTSDALKIKSSAFRFYLTYVSIFVFLLFGVFLLNAVASERMSLFGLGLVYPYVIKRMHEKFGNPFFIATSVTLLGFLPMLAFGTREFIFA